ncbi:MAG TPA: hypothetical protein VE776_01755 [Actinomycetota bacterium]|nr:hypothetical protein [Actinomycetota bacterium]
MAVREQSRARVIYSLPEQRRPGSPGGFGVFGLLAIALALFAGGLMIGRWTGAAPQRQTPVAQRGATPQAPAATSDPTPAQTAPAQAVPASRPLTVNGEQVWSGRTLNGVPVGWDHSEAGAVGAATNYTAALASSELMFDDARRGAAVETVAAPQARARLARDLENQAKLIAASFFGIQDADAALAQVVASKVVFQTIPVRYRLDAYDGDRARVSIWQTGVGGYQDSSLPPQEAWGMTTVQLQWIDKDWKETGATVTDGPVPVADSNPPTPAPDLIHELQQFKDYHYAPAS